MLKNIEKNKCCGCSACYNICPQNAITMQTDDKGFKYPIIDEKKCINCGLCQKVCPAINKNKEVFNKISAYCCFNKNETERLNSSSGGIFILLARYILQKNGVVFGASLDENFIVKHVCCDNENEIYKLMGSKYVQSEIGHTYKSVKKFLNNDQYVLFTGTPCQIEGLKAYLRKDYDKLYTQDIICHGAPSPLVWEKYKKYRKETDNEVPTNITFRNKDNGWCKYNLKFTYKNFSYKNNQANDEYLKAFLKNVCLRESCYNCMFKKKNRISDITLADYWCVSAVHPEMFDDKGTSLVIINSEKGNDLFENIKDSIVCKKTDLDTAIKYNPSMIKSAKKDAKSDDFYKSLDKVTFDKSVKKYTSKQSIFSKILLFIKRILRKIIKICIKR